MEILNYVFVLKYNYIILNDLPTRNTVAIMAQNCEITYQDQT